MKRTNTTVWYSKQLKQLGKNKVLKNSGLEAIRMVPMISAISVQCSTK